MQLEDYFDFLAPNDIRVKETRVGIETILNDYLEQGLYAEEIAARYPTLTLEQTYATLAYYWHNRPQVDAYLRVVQVEVEQERREQAVNPSPAIKRLCELARQRDEQRRTEIAVAVPT